VAWGDYDNDGRLDVIEAGRVPNAGIAFLFVLQNTGGVFTNLVTNIGKGALPSIALGDYDNDGTTGLSLQR